MRKVSVSETVRLPVSDVWSLITNLDLYPKFVKFVKSVSYSKKLQKGSGFHDVTTIMWVPIRVHHHVEVFEVNKTLGFYVKMLFNGFMRQRVYLTSKGNTTTIEQTVEFSFNNPLLDFLAGPILEKRVKEMLYHIVQKGKEAFEK